MNNLVKSIACVLLFQTACTQPVENIKKVSVPKETPAILLSSDTDPYCKMKVDKHFSDTTMYHAKTYGFCSIVCKEGFQKNPEKYLIK